MCGYRQATCFDALHKSIMCCAVLCCAVCAMLRGAVLRRAVPCRAELCRAERCGVLSCAVICDYVHEQEMGVKTWESARIARSSVASTCTHDDAFTRTGPGHFSLSALCQQEMVSSERTR